MRLAASHCSRPEGGLDFANLSTPCIFCPSRSCGRSRGRCRARMCGREITLRQDAASSSWSRRCYSFRSARAHDFLFACSCFLRQSGSLSPGAPPPFSFLCPSASLPHTPPAAAALVRSGSSNSGLSVAPDARSPSPLPRPPPAAAAGVRSGTNNSGSSVAPDVRPSSCIGEPPMRTRFQCPPAGGQRDRNNAIKRWSAAGARALGGRPCCSVA